MCGTSMSLCAKLSLAFLIVVFIYRTTASGILEGTNNDILYKRIRRDLPGCNPSALGEDDLCIKSSDEVPGQLVIFNATEESALIINPKISQYGFISTDGKGIFFDEERNLGFQAERGNWSNAVPRCALLFGIPKLRKNLRPIKFTSIGTHHPFNVFLKKNICFFGHNIKSLISTATGNVLAIIRQKIWSVIHVIKSVLRPIIDFETKKWMIFKGGLVCIATTFKWITQYVAEFVGGINVLAANAVRFPLMLIIGAKSGIQAFFVMLKTIVRTFDISIVLKSIIESPTKIVEYVTGLGGDIMSGITGVFKVVCSILRLIHTIVLEPWKAITGFSENIRILINIVLDFFFCQSRQPIDKDQLNKEVDDMLSIVDEQDKRFRNGKKLQIFISVWKASIGKDELNIHGIHISVIIQTLLKRTKSGVELVTNIFNILKPLLPFSALLPNFLTNLLRTVNRNNGLEEIKKIMPDVDFGDVGIVDERSRSILTDNLTTAELIKKSPIAQKIYDRIDTAIRSACNGNVSDTDMLSTEWDTTDLLRKELISLM